MKTKFITILDFMIDELNLSGNELILYALIYGFSQDGNSEFYGSLRYIQKFLKLTRPTIINILKKLQEKNLIEKTSVSKYKVVKKLYQGGKETLPVGGKETLPNIYNTNNNYIYSVENKKTQDTTPINSLSISSLNQKKEKEIKNKEKEIRADLSDENQKAVEITKYDKTIENNTVKTTRGNSKILFVNSIYANEEEVIRELIKIKTKYREMYAMAYIPYYIESVLNWSDAKEVKRTNRGWLATIRNFIKQDKVDGKLMTAGRYKSLFGKENKIDRSNSNLF